MQYLFNNTIVCIKQHIGNRQLHTWYVCVCVCLYYWFINDIIPSIMCYTIFTSEKNNEKSKKEREQVKLCAYRRLCL